MKLQSIRLSEFRRFADAVELTGLAPGLNLFVGPNESGKSTIAAALRAAFLERYKTSKVAGFAPYGVSGARPTVELAFDYEGRHYTLRKSFLAKARCELGIGDAQRLEGEQAEDALAQLLGFEYSAKGTSRPEHAGIPGLLWIQQGGSGSLEPTKHAGAHLRDALARVSGELTSTDGDRLLDRVSGERNELLDSRGKPRGVYREAEARWHTAQTEREQYWQAHKAFEQALDRLNGLQQAQAADDQEQPWRVFENKVAEARGRQYAISQERDGLERLVRERRQLESTITLLLEQVARDQADEEEVRRLARERDAATDGQAGAERALVLAQQRETDAQSALGVARKQLEAARLAAERRDILALRERQLAEILRQETALANARSLAEAEVRVRAQLAGMPWDADDVEDLRQTSRKMDELSVQRAAAATRLRYTLPDAAVMLDGEPLAGAGERLLTDVAHLVLPDGGSLTIEPGGTDLARLSEQDNVLRERRHQLLQRLDANDLSAVETRGVQRQALQQEADAAHREMTIHAPQGIDALAISLQEAQASLQRLETRLQESGAEPEAAPDRDQAALQDECKAREAALAQAAGVAAERRQQLHAIRAEAGQLTARLQHLRQQLETEESRQRQAQRNRRLTELRSERSDLDQRIGEAESRIAQHRPDIVDQDIERFERSARIARDAYQERQREILLLQGRLDEAGAQGTGEALAASEAALEHWSRRHEGLRKRAQALDLLHGLLRDQRNLTTQKLLSPLSQRLAHYLSLLFPSASLQVDETLTPGALLREGERDDLGDLSFGTQEQLGILLRFAYADLLKSAGRPTLLILDDALVHTDEQRREWMKRALFDAAQRHQILMFTCHPEAWRDLGVPQRALPPA